MGKPKGGGGQGSALLFGGKKDLTTTLNVLSFCPRRGPGVHGQTQQSGGAQRAALLLGPLTHRRLLLGASPAALQTRFGTFLFKSMEKALCLLLPSWKRAQRDSVAIWKP